MLFSDFKKVNVLSLLPNAFDYVALYNLKQLWCVKSLTTANVTLYDELLFCSFFLPWFFQSFLWIMACMTFFLSFPFFFAVFKDSWEDLTDLVEQLRDDTEGACHTNIFQLFFPFHSQAGFWCLFFLFDNYHWWLLCSYVCLEMLYLLFFVPSLCIFLLKVSSVLILRVHPCCHFGWGGGEVEWDLVLIAARIWYSPPSIP